MSSSRAGPVPSRIGVRSMITVTYLSPRRVWRQTCSSTPMTLTPSNRVGSSIRTRLPSARTASLAVFHATAEALGDPGDGQVLAPRSPSSAHRSPRRDSFARGSAAGAGVLAPHVPAAGAPVAAHRDPAASSVATRTARAPTAGSRCHAAAPSQPHRRHHWSGSTTRHASTARSGSSRCPVTSRPSSSRRQNVVRSGRREGSVRHVEVFRMGGVGTSILGRPRPLPGDRRAAALHPHLGRATLR